MYGTKLIIKMLGLCLRLLLIIAYNTINIDNAAEQVEMIDKIKMEVLKI